MGQKVVTFSYLESRAEFARALDDVLDDDEKVRVLVGVEVRPRCEVGPLRGKVPLPLIEGDEE